MSLRYTPFFPSVPGVLTHQSAVNQNDDFWATVGSGGGGGGGNASFSNLTVTGVEQFNDFLGGGNFGVMYKKGTDMVIQYDPQNVGGQVFAIAGAGGSVINFNCSQTVTDFSLGPTVVMPDISGVQTINGSSYIPSGAYTTYATISFPSTVVNAGTLLLNLVDISIGTTLKANTTYMITIPYNITVSGSTPSGVCVFTILASDGLGSVIGEPVFYPGVPVGSPYQGTISGMIMTGSVPPTFIRLGIDNPSGITLTLVGTASTTAPLYIKEV